MKKELTIIGLLVFNSSLALECVNDRLDSPGVCINETYNYFGSDFYKSCYFNPYYDYGDPWPGYVTCTGTIWNETLSDDNTPVASAWSNETGQLIECRDYNGLACDVFSTDGFTTDDSATDRGFCDASDENCVKCNSNNVETKVWNGGGWIIGTGDGQCESGCGAGAPCDEENPNSWSDNRVSSGSPLEAHCNLSCVVDESRCRESFGADSECNYLADGSACKADECINNQFYDYNGNGLFDSSICANCLCDTDPGTPLCDAGNCDASSECDGEEPGYNNTHQGCNDSCTWLTCDPYAWNETSNDCLTKCESNGHCYNTVCDLVNDNSNTCVTDEEEPVVSIFYPANLPHLNDSFDLSFIVTDEVDALLDCEYSVDNDSPVSIGEVSQGVNTETIIPDSEGWHAIQVTCSDDSSNEGSSDFEAFLFDESPPTYSDFGWTNATVLHPSGIITFLDDLVLHAYWTDDFHLNTSVVWTNKTGEWTIEGVIEHEGVSESWSNVTLDLEDYGDNTISYRIVTNDSAGNEFTTVEDSFYVWHYTTDIEVNLSEFPVNGFLEWTADAQPKAGVEPIDSLRTELLGDFNVTHAGVGLPINISFWLDDSLGDNFVLKLNDELDYDNAITLTTDAQQGCFQVDPTEACQVWVWLDWNGDESPGTIDNIIRIESFIS